MIQKMCLFEWRYFTRQPSFWLTALIFFGLPFLAATLNQAGMGGANLLKNGPYNIAQMMLFLGLFALFLIVNFVADTAMRDDSSEMAEIIYCKPMKPFGYRLGRFLGAFGIVITVFALVPLGMLLGGLMPWVDATRFGPVMPSFYLTSFFYLSVPTLFVFSCLFYALAIRTKSMMAVYLAVIAVIVLYEISDKLFVDSRELAALFDPFGWRAFNEITRYWTLVEKNSQMLTLDGVLGLNRLLWLGVGVVMMMVLGGFSRPLALKTVNKKSRDKTDTRNPPLDNRIDYKGQANTTWHQFIARTVFEVKQVVFDRAFLILCGCTLLLLLAVIAEPKGMFGTQYLPVTQSMVEQIRQAMGLLSVIVITYYSAEVVWRERGAGMGDIINSLPVLNVSFWLSKLVAVWLVLILLLILAMGTTVLFQLDRGYERLDIGQYAISLLYFSALPWMMKAVLAFFFQVLSPNKSVGMLAFVLFVAADFAMVPLGLDHHMFRFSQSPSWVYSDMNGYGGALLGHSWYMLYWGALSLALAVLGYALWQRGPQESLSRRLNGLAYQLGRGGKLILTVCTLVFIFSGSNIFYNTRILNDYLTGSQLDQIHLDYEKRYAQFADAPMPTMTKLNAAVDIFPAQRKLVVEAKMQVSNQTTQPIERFLVSMPGYNAVLANRPGYSQIDFSLTFDGGNLGPLDGALNTHWFEFDQPLQPGEQRSGQFSVMIQQQGFSDKPSPILLIENGTFIQNSEIMPRFGYRRGEQLIDPAARAKANLPPPQRAHKLEDSRYYQQSTIESMLGVSSGYIDFETTVSTSIDQIAIASGELQREWTEHNRRYFHYKMNAPIENYFTYLSGRYETLKTRHNGVAIDIYHHPEHDMNVEIMQQALKDSLDYYGENFGPYQHQQTRIIEFPGPAVFAQDFPNAIAYSERSGFIHDLRDEQGIDSVYYMTAHEMAHQWWGGQVDGANVQGGTMLVETLAQYSALMLTRKRYGDGKLRQMLKSELDGYLQGRTREAVEELPLMRVENQPYIHYHKGSLVMMALVDLLGETRTNQALKAFLSRYKFSKTAYPTTVDLLKLINQDTSEQEKAAINRLFAQINLYDIKATNLSVEAVNDHQFEVTLIVNAQRSSANGQGVETVVPLDELVTIGLYSADPDDSKVGDKPLYMGKHPLKSGKNVLKILVSQQPKFAVADPMVTLIDKDVGDNLIEGW